MLTASPTGTTGRELPPTPAIPPSGPLPPAQDTRSPRVKFANWMEHTFGPAYLPITMLGGAAIGGGVGMLLGIPGAVVGAVGGAMLAGALIFSD